jgi:23S rRNA (cytidine1920-2'-O)/16S rRNA (cytidine1409-2'-O)-methyltransferase
MAKERLDVIVVQRNLLPSRERAKACIMAGRVFVNGQKIDKPGTLIGIDAEVTVHGDSIGYVSRGGLKLAKALDYFSIDISGKIAADVGASTGGFTDCMLKKGAAKVYAIDVGYGQLAWSLRTDPRVINMERTNVRNISLEDIGEKVEFVSIDVAFISLDKVLPAVKKFLQDHGTILALIKPQFEAGREKVGKKGVVRDPLTHIEVISKVINTAQSLKLTPLGLTYSPIKGPEGNIEYLVYLLNYAADSNVSAEIIEQIVREAHSNLDK